MFSVSFAQKRRGAGVSFGNKKGGPWWLGWVSFGNKKGGPWWLGWAGLGWAGLGWAGLGWAGLGLGDFVPHGKMWLVWLPDIGYVRKDNLEY
jgi:hypothetical protein